MILLPRGPRKTNHSTVKNAAMRPPSRIFATGERLQADPNASWHLESIFKEDMGLPASLLKILSEPGGGCSSIQTLPVLRPFQIVLYMVSNNLSTPEHMDLIVRWIHSTESFKALEAIARIQMPSAKVLCARLFTYAIDKGDLYVARALLAGGLSQQESYRSSRLTMHSALFKSIKGNHWDLAKLLVSSGGYTRGSIHLEFEAFRRISSVLSYDLIWRMDEEPAHLEAIIEVLEALIKAGATFETSEVEAWKWIHGAAHVANWLGLVAVLNQSEVISQRNRKLDDELHHAVKFKDVTQVRELCGRGANIESWEPSRCLPIVLAVKNEDCEMVRVLLELGADPNEIFRPIKDMHFSQTWHGPPSEYTGALHMAAGLGNSGMVEILLEGRADTSIIDGYGRTALHCLAAIFPSRKLEYPRVWSPEEIAEHPTLVIAKQLLSCGADVNARTRDDECRTVIDIVLCHTTNRPCEAMAELLLDFQVQIPGFDANSNANVKAIEAFLTSLRWEEIPLKKVIRFCRKHYHRFTQQKQLPFTTWLNGLFKEALSLGHYMAMHELLDEGADFGLIRGLPYKEVSSWAHCHEDYGDMVSRRDIMWKAVALGSDINDFREQHTIPFLSLAIMDEDYAMVDFLISKGANVTRYPRSGMCSPLHLAVSRSSDVFIYTTTKAIIARGANVNAPEYITLSGRSFFEAREDPYWRNFGDFFVNYYFIRNFYFDGDFTVPFFRATPVQAACLYGKMTAVQLLFENGGDINAPASEPRGFTALQLAVLIRNKDIVQYLLDNGAHFNSPSAAEVGLTALQCAIFIDDAKSINMLISLGADAGAPAAARIGYTALQAALINDNLELAHTLLASGVDVNAAGGSESGRTALQAACYNNNLELAEILLQHSADVNAPPCKFRGATALQCAAMNGNLDLVVKLLDCGADIDAPGAEVCGRTALQAAAGNGRLDITNLLLQRHPDPLSLKDKCDEAAKLAENEEHIEIAELLRNWEILTFPHDALRLEDLQVPDLQVPNLQVPLTLDEMDIGY